MDAAGDLAQLVQRAGRPGGGPAELRRQLAGPGGTAAWAAAQPQGESDQPLLGAVVQVPLDAPAGGIGGGHDPGPRRRQLRPALRIGDGRGDQLGEPGQARLGLRRKRSSLSWRPRHDAPQLVLDRDRRSDRRADAAPVGEIPSGARDIAVIVRAAPAASRTPACSRSPAEPSGGRPGRARHAGAGPRGDGRGPAVRLVAEQTSVVGRQQAARPPRSPRRTPPRAAHPATSVATRRRAACSSAIRRNSAYSWALSRDTASWPAMSLTASSRSAVNAPRMRRFSSTSTARRLPRPKIGTASSEQHRASAKYGSRANRSSAARVAHDQWFTHPPGVPQHRHRDRDRSSPLPLTWTVPPLPLGRAAASLAGPRSTAAGARR